MTFYFEDDNLQMYISGFELEAQGELNYEGMEMAINGDYDEAEKTLLNALSIDTTNIVVINNLGNVNKFQGKYAKAESYFEHAFKMSDSTYFPAALNLGTLYMEREEMRKAEEIYLHFAKSSNIDFIVGVSYFLLARMYCKGGWIDKAEASIEMAKKDLMKYEGFQDPIEEVESFIENYEE